MAGRPPMRSPPVVAIVGATGAVGVELLRCLEQRRFPLSELRLLASARSAGKSMPFRDQELTVRELGEDSFRGVDLALFSAGAATSQRFAPVDGTGRGHERVTMVLRAALRRKTCARPRGATAGADIFRQVGARIGAQQYEAQLVQAEAQLARDQAQLAGLKGRNAGEAETMAAQANVILRPLIGPQWK